MPGLFGRRVISGVVGGGSFVRWWSMAGYVIAGLERFILAVGNISGAGIVITSPIRVARSMINGWISCGRIQIC